MMHEMGRALAEVSDFMKAQKEINNPKKMRNDEFDFSMGFNANTYLDLVKKNIKGGSKEKSMEN